MISASCYPANYWSPIDELYGECQCCGERYHEDDLNEDGYCKHCLEEMEDEENDLQS